MTGPLPGTLRGKRIVNTRAAHQAQALDSLLQAKGAIPLAYPCIAIVPPDDSAVLDAALRDLAADRYDWLMLTSANTVLAIAARLNALGLTLAGKSFQVGAIGPATAHAAAQIGLCAEELPERYIAESLAVGLPVREGTRVLLPESAIARTVLADLLMARGAEVQVVAAYRTVRGHGGAAIPQLLAQGQIDALTFTSSSTVTNFFERLRAENSGASHALELCAACIGPKTAATARDYGFTLLAVSTEHTLEGLVSALDEFFTRRMVTSEPR